MNNKFCAFAAVAGVAILLGLTPAASGYVYDTTAAGARWPGPTLPVRIQMGPSRLTVSDATITNKTVNGFTTSTVTSASAAFDIHGVVGMTVTGTGIPVNTIVQSISSANNVVSVTLSNKATTVGSGMTLSFVRVLKDGSASWDKMAENAFAIWNEHMKNLQVTWTEAAPGTPAHDGNGSDLTSIQWSLTLYGQSYGGGVLAVTLVNFSGSQMTECDVLFNSKINYDSYRGQRQSITYDVHRVAIHEFGHVLGLDHPDQNHPEVGYTAPNPPPTAIMDAIVSPSIDNLLPDDIAGIHSLYIAPPNEPTSQTGNARLGNISTRAQVGTGSNILIGGFIIQGSLSKKVLIRAKGPSLTPAGVSGALANPFLTLFDGTTSIASNDDWQSDPATAQALRDIGFDQGMDARDSALVVTVPPGNQHQYTAQVRGAAGETGIALVEIYDLDAPTPSASKIANISTRAQVGTGENVLIGGFIITTAQTKTVVIRALGPSLPVQGALANPTMELRTANGDLFQSNDNYNNPTNGDNSAMYAVGLQPTNTLESALSPLLAPGNYTVIVKGVSNGTGVGSVEVYGLQ